MTGKLLARLLDPAKSGLYRVAAPEAVLDAARDPRVRLARIALSPGAGKAEMLAAIARALDFPDWFGANWDALEDCLTDLAWSPAEAHVLLVEGAGEARADDLRTLEDVLAAAAAFWAARGRAFFAVFVGGPARLAALHRERQ
ncbi:MAG: barstar family protein [Burkholderiales bacterium]|nr:barstar family protein [Burkholderiales bacterium]